MAGTNYGWKGERVLVGAIIGPLTAVRASISGCGARGGDLGPGLCRGRGRLALGAAREKAQTDELAVTAVQPVHHLRQTDAVRECFLRGLHRHVKLPQAVLVVHGRRLRVGRAARIARAICSGVVPSVSASSVTPGSWPVRFRQRSRSALILRLSSFNERLTLTVPPSRNSFLISPRMTGTA